MAATAVGSRIVVQGAAAPLVLRSLRAIQLEGGWAVPVMADLAALTGAGIEPGPVEAQFTTADGVVSLDAEIVHSEGVFVVRAPGLRAAAITDQRRDDVRAAVTLSLRGTLLASGVAAVGDEDEQDAGDHADDEVTRRDGPQGPRDILEGMTRTVSAGGLCVAFDSLPATVRPGARLYLELRMPGGDLAPAIVAVVERQPAKRGVRLRVRFIDISPLDRERLVRMVFARQRADLAQRTNSLS